MKSRVVSIAVLSLLCLMVPATWAQSEIQVTVSLDRDTIGMDEQAVLEVVVTGTEQNLPAPQMPSLAMFETYSQGRSTNISIVNGQVSSSITYRYMLLPTKSGAFPIDNIAVVYNNKRYKGNRVELTVLDRGVAASPQLEEKAVDTQGKSRDYFLEAVVNKTSPYVNEQVTLTLKFYIAVRYYGTPELNEPSTTGFWTEVLGNMTPYFQKLHNRNYRVIERKYALFPTQAGELTIGQATITVNVPSTSRRRDPFGMDLDDFFGRGENVTIRSAPVKLNVKPLPVEGRPANFTGTIGMFGITATPDKTTVEVNQPITVTIKITGTGNIKSVAEPLIPDLPDFRVYKASSNEKTSIIDEQLGGTKIYEEVFIPNKPGNLEIPSLEFNFFDPKTRKYQTVKTRSIQITVKQPEGYAVSPEVPYSQSGVVIGKQASDIRFIKNDIGRLTSKGRLVIFTPLYMVINGLFVVSFVSLLVLRLHREKMTGNIGYARSRKASRMAQKRLTRARSLAKVEKISEFYAEISLALLAYIADKLNISPHGLTSDRVTALLKEKGADDALVEDTLALLHKCDFARFAPATLNQEDINQSLENTRQIMVKMETVKFV
ncbi:MAG: BatD family protein [candidate division Zixibacteria bacterium]|nr:BatD family protein [candidate division Zixibacteria bacterium]